MNQIIPDRVIFVLRLRSTRRLRNVDSTEVAVDPTTPRRELLLRSDEVTD